MRMGPRLPGAPSFTRSLGSFVIVRVVVVLIPVIAPVSPVSRRHTVDIARNRTVAHEDPGTVVAAGAIPVAVVVHVPVVPVAIDVVIGVLDVVHATRPGDGDQLRLRAERDRRTAVA